VRGLLPKVQESGIESDRIQRPVNLADGASDSTSEIVMSDAGLTRGRCRLVPRHRTALHLRPGSSWVYLP
jgi:hypothetical protein